MSDDILNSDQWVLRKIFQIQWELGQIGLTLQQIGYSRTEYPNLHALLFRRNEQLMAEFCRYEKIVMNRDAALKEREEDLEELERITREESKGHD